MNKLILGNSLKELKGLEDNSVDSIVTDPPYELGFMGKKWDNTGIAYNIDLWAECLRVLKPGGHLLAFSGTRTYHRMAVAIEDAGFEVRDMIEWVYGSGFPKSLNIGKSVDKLQGNEREVVGQKKGNINAMPDGRASRSDIAWDSKVKEFDLTKGTSKWEGWGTALKPAHEPICMARKPLAEKNVAQNCLKWGTGGINIDESRVEEGGRFPANLIHDNSDEVRECFPETKSGGAQKGSVIKSKGGGYGVEALGKVKKITGIPFDSGSASRFFKSIIYNPKASKAERNKGCEGLEERDRKEEWGDKFGAVDRRLKTKNQSTGTFKNHHPTVKPIALMEYLIKMVTPKGGTVLDPFMGSGSTGVAAKKNGYDFIGIDMTPEYIEIAKARINATEIENRLI